jgi:hypothetical protein
VSPPFKIVSLTATLFSAELFTIIMIYVRARPFGQAGIAEEFLIMSSVSCKYVHKGIEPTHARIHNNQ